jgi:hypothetical protein
MMEDIARLLGALGPGGDNLQGGVGYPGSGPGGTPGLPFGGYPPEAFGNRAGMGYTGPSPSAGLGSGFDFGDDTEFLNTLAPNRGPSSFAGSAAGSLPGYGGEPIVQVPTTRNVPFGLLTPNQTQPQPISAQPTQPPLPDWLLNAVGNTTGHNVRRAEPLPDWMLNALATQSGMIMAQNPIGARGVGGQGGSFFGGRGSLNVPGGGSLGPLGAGSSGNIGGFNWQLALAQPDIKQMLMAMGAFTGGRVGGGYTGRGIKTNE